MITRILFLVSIILSSNIQSQILEFEHELGLSAGASHYFGDLNPNLDFQRPGPSLGAFYRLNMDHRFAIRAGFSRMNVGYKDEYSGFEQNKQRNLSFNSNITDLHALLEFNFLKFVKNVYYNEHGWRYTPYLTLGAGVFFFNPTTEFKGQTYDLQPLGTEGQNDESYVGNSRYNLFSWSINYGIGMKYHIVRNVSCGLDFQIRRTFTDYIDDVSGNYVPIISLPGEDKGLAYDLYDRSKEIGPAIGVPGRSRGSKRGADDYATLMITFSWTFIKPFCPKEGSYN